MHFSKQIALTLALAFTTTVTAVDDLVEPVDPHLSVEEQCSYQIYGTTRWNVVINDATDFTDDECGSGFLDNINGRGCSVTGWGCNYAEDGTTMNAGFASDVACGSDDMSAAINAAFGGKTVDCHDYDVETDLPW